MLKGIAKILGGYFSPEDYKDSWEDFRGMFWDEDGLIYHYKYAAIHNKMIGNDDITGLKQSIEEWNASIKRKH